MPVIRIGKGRAGWQEGFVTLYMRFLESILHDGSLLCRKCGRIRIVPIFQYFLDCTLGFVEDPCRPSQPKELFLRKRQDQIALESPGK